MQNDFFETLTRYAEGLCEPENLFSGERLPKKFAVPDNILVFFHNFTASAPNSHGRYTLVIPLDRMTYYLDQRRLEIAPGSVLLIPPHAMRFLHPGSEGYRRLFVTFELPDHQAYLPEPGLCEITPAARRILWNVLNNYENRSPETCSAELILLLHTLNATPAECGEARLPLPIVKAVEFIEKHLSNPIGICDVAEAAGVSESHLRLIFRTGIGVSLGKYIAQKRLDAAKYRLLHSTMTLAEIAAGCGFQNVFVFGAFFKKNAGISPMRFRKTAASHGPALPTE